MDNIKLIACDMDDTLLNSDGKISPKNTEAIRKAIGCGKVFLLATGRMYVSALPHAINLGLNVPLVTYNGALVKETYSGDVLYEHKMKLQTASDVMRYCKKKNLYVQLYIGNNIFIKEENAYSRMYSRISGIPTDAIGDDVFLPWEEPYKILVMSEEEFFLDTWNDIAENFAGHLDVTSSKKNFLELMEPGVNKWEAVKNVAARSDIKPCEIMCIGDSNNDIGMIANAGVGVAVANARKEVKKHAKIVTASNSGDGVALVINSILMNAHD